MLAQAPRTAACPQCRQTGVYPGAMLMKKLGIAITRRYTSLGLSNFNSQHSVSFMLVKKLGVAITRWYGSEGISMVLLPQAAGAAGCVSCMRLTSRAESSAGVC